MNYGYIRVSSTDQNEDRQVIAMEKLPETIDRIYMDKKSGANFNRPEYKKMLRKVTKGDVIFVPSLDRFGRNKNDICDQWRIITREKQAHIVVMNMPLLDTRKGGDLLGTFIADLVLQVLSFVAEMEREQIRRRQAEGIHAAKLRGVKFGRTKKPLPDGFNELAERWKRKEITGTYAASQLNMARSTFYRHAIGDAHPNYRPKKYPESNYAENLSAWKAGQIAFTEAARRSGVSPHTFKTWLDWKEKYCTLSGDEFISEVANG